MSLVILARDRTLGAIVKEFVDRRGLGLAQMVCFEEPAGVDDELVRLTPSAVLIVSRRLDASVIEVSRRLVTHPATRHAPIVVAADVAEEHARIAALEAGVRSVVQPLQLTAIERRLHAARQVVNIHQPFQGSALSFDALGSTVIVFGQAVALTPLEAGVLRLLVHRRDGVVSRSELEQRIWGGVRSRTVDVHIARLRKKLGPVGRQIQTVVKFGYRYVEQPA